MVMCLRPHHVPTREAPDSDCIYLRRSSNFSRDALKLKLGSEQKMKGIPKRTERGDYVQKEQRGTLRSDGDHCEGGAHAFTAGAGCQFCLMRFSAPPGTLFACTIEHPLAP
jgi:hypothetical protein